MANQLFATNDGLKYGVYAVAGPRWVGLYMNDLPLPKGFDPSLLVECDFSGYAKIEIPPGSWSFPAVIDSDGNASCYAPQIEFNKVGATPNANVYGFFYTATDTTQIWAAQPFVDGPYPMVLDGDFIRITPRVVASNPIFP